MIETTLFAKTMVILCSQLSIVFGLTFYVMKKSKEAYFNNTTFLGISFRGAMNLKQEFDLIPYIEDTRGFPKYMHLPNGTEDDIPVVAVNEESRVKWQKIGYVVSPPANKFLNAVFVSWAILLLSLTFIGYFSVPLGIFVFTAQSILMGLLLGVLFLEMDENDGIRALKITLLATLFSGFIGYSDVGYAIYNSGLVQNILFFGLLALIFFEFSRTVFKFSRNTIRLKAFFGIGLFILFLFYDFARLNELSGYSNKWDTAFEIALSLYLDIINLLLEILEAMD
ncbi:Bax inhibitor-1 family protein [Gammaproteobacteria bacterium]|nr:Bax inhibitor-1 family protein [Gammaproteobacteria bacterium]